MFKKIVSHFMTSGSQPLMQQGRNLLALFLSMLVITLLSDMLSPDALPLLLVASIGASMILVFVLPSSPVSQPYPLIMGHFVSAVIGVSCSYLPFDLYLTAAICISSSLLAMLLFKAVHPPAAATAMMPVIVGPLAVGGYYFTIFPVLLNVVVLTIMGIVLSRYWLKVEYPRNPTPTEDPVHKHKDASPLARLGISRKDLESSMKEYGAFLNITEKDMAEVYGLAQQKSYHRKFGEIRCKDIMSKDVISVVKGTGLEEAWAILRLHKIKLLPVIDENNKILGILSLVDYLKRANLKNYDGFSERLTRFVRQDQNMMGSKPSRVGQIMATPVFSVDQNELIASLVPLLSDKGLHHIPVTDEEQSLVGIVTQSDLIAALYSGSINMEASTSDH